MMDIIITINGDSAAGIPDSSWTVENIHIDDTEHRETVRGAFQLAFGELTGNLSHVVFSDELPPDFGCCYPTEESDECVIGNVEDPLACLVAHGGKLTDKSQCRYWKNRRAE